MCRFHLQQPANQLTQFLGVGTGVGGVQRGKGGGDNDYNLS